VRHTVIHTAYSYFLRDDWPLWLESVGLRELEFAGEIAYDLFLPCVEAAIFGLGVVMGRAPVVDHDLAAGRLVAPFGNRIVLKTGYYVACPEERATLRKVRLFKEWVLGRSGTRDIPA
jgi:LysR family glycine cleavage system transcriptional activator